MSFLKPYMTPKSRLLANPPGSENDEDEYHPLAAGEEKEDVIHKIFNNIKQEVLSDEERLPQSSVHTSPGTSGEHQHLNSDSEREHIEKTKEAREKVAGSKRKGLKRKHMVSDNDSLSKQPCVNIIVPAGRDKDGNLTISLANEKPKPKRLRYVNFASNLPGGPSTNNINHQSILSLNNPQSANINNTTPVIIMNEKSIEKIISNFENSNISNIAISNVIGNCTRASNNNVVSNTAAASSGTSENQFAITSSGDKPSGTGNTPGTSVNNSAAQTNVSSFFKNVGVQCEIRNIDRDGESTKEKYSINDLKDGAVAVFVHPKSNLPTSDDESEGDGLVSRNISVRKYSIPEFRCPSNLANTLYSGNREQVYRAIRTSNSSNRNKATRSIELFIASIYETIKKLPWQAQNVVKTRSLEFLKVAEEEFEEVKVQWNKNEKINSPKAQTENFDLELTSLNPSNNQENQDASKDNQDASKDNQDASNKHNQDASRNNCNQDSSNKNNQDASKDNQDASKDNQDASKDNQDASNKNNQDASSNNCNQDASNKLNQDASNNNNQIASNMNNQDTSKINNHDSTRKDNQAVSNHINQSTSYYPEQSYDMISSLESVLSIFGDNDSRHIALRLFLASLYESMKDMPRFLLRYLKANLMQLVVHVEEIYNNPDDFRNTAMSNKKSE